MSLNLKQLIRRRRQLCGETVTIELFNVHGELEAITSLMSSGEAVTKRNILLVQMEAALPFVSPEMRPFCESVLHFMKQQKEK